MNRFALEVENWTEFELVKDFPSLDRAKRYGRERFSQNSWRVLDSNSVVFEYDPFETIQQEAGRELSRFAQTEKWRQIFAEKRADDIRRRQEQERLEEMRVRQREQQLEIDRRRRPWWDHMQTRSNPVVERVNWLKEGF